jgi:hypothetical protein
MKNLTNPKIELYAKWFDKNGKPETLRFTTKEVYTEIRNEFIKARFKKLCSQSDSGIEQHYKTISKELKERYNIKLAPYSIQAIMTGLDKRYKQFLKSNKTKGKKSNKNKVK